MLIELGVKNKNQERPPPDPQIAAAWRAFFRFRNDTKFPLEDVQISHTMRGFLHLQNNYNDTADFGLPSEDLRVALMAMRNMPVGADLQGHSRLAKMIFEELQKRREKSEQLGEERVPSFKKELIPFLVILCKTGESTLARDTLEKYIAASKFPTNLQEPWRKILQGFEKEGNPEEMERTVEMMKAIDIGFDAKSRVVPVRYYSNIDDAEKTRKWYEHPVDGAKPETIALTDWLVLKHCLRTDNIQWGESIIRRILENEPSKGDWDTVFRWSAARGKGVDEMERMMDIMINRNEGRETPVRPDINTINYLIRIANDNDDPYTAERYISLAYKWGLKPDAQTYMLQLTYRLNVGDLEGARAAYNSLQAFDISSETLNARTEDLLLALYSSPAYKSKPDPIFLLFEDLLDRRARLRAPTIAALLELYISRGELQEVVSILRGHSFHLSVSDRQLLLNILISFIQNPHATTTQAWDGYQILRSHFPETSIPVRTSLMEHFFTTRHRSDMGTHIFGHMRQGSTPDTRPTTETYRRCFTQLAHAKDFDHLLIVHNMFKLDAFIDPDTRLYNSLMLAYHACGQSKQALTFWDDIAHSREGPTYSSIRIALRACELSPWGDRYAKDIWKRVKKFGIDPHAHGLIGPYLKALVRQGLIDEAKRVVKQEEEVEGKEVRPEWLGGMYNAAGWQGEKRKEVVRWARGEYGRVWEMVEEGGMVDVEGEDVFVVGREGDEGLDP